MAPRGGAENESERLEGEALDLLIELARLDEKIDLAEETKYKRPRELEQQTRAVAAQQKKVDEAHEMVVAAKKRIDALNVESQGHEAEIKRLEGQLFSLKTNEEFNAMKHQIKGREEKNEQVQDRILELMMALDELEDRLKAETEALEDERKLLAEEERRTQEDLARAETRIKDLGAKREELAAKLPADLYQLYQSVRTRRGGVGLAHVEGDICKGCDTGLLPQIVARLAARHLETCPHCDRILYL
ncbi:MAG TPA: hypothetical protein ENK43_08150 [Planctomycetes bacterium]|nr:hypothetical protein [Planctomycetota bacterium]